MSNINIRIYVVSTIFLTEDSKEKIQGILCHIFLFLIYGFEKVPKKYLFLIFSLEVFGEVIPAYHTIVLWNLLMDFFFLSRFFHISLQ